MFTWPKKDPNEILDYSINWAPRLEADTIITSEWLELPEEATLTIVSDEHNDTITTVWLSGGTIGEQYVLTNRIETNGGRTMDQSVRLKIKER